MSIATPPDHLTPDQAAIWCSVLSSLEAGWITPETHDLLAAYCQHVSQQRRLGALIAAHEAMMFDPGTDAIAAELDVETLDTEPLPAVAGDWVKTYDKLLKMLDRENRALSSLATRLRITNQSLRSSKADKPARKIRPWETPSQPEAE